MSKLVLIEEYHVAFQVPRNLPARAGRAVRRALDSRAFRSKIGRAIREVAKRIPALEPLRIRLTR